MVHGGWMEPQEGNCFTCVYIGKILLKYFFQGSLDQNISNLQEGFVA
jgi:hypothetical protein